MTTSQDPRKKSCRPYDVCFVHSCTSRQHSLVFNIRIMSLLSGRRCTLMRIMAVRSPGLYHNLSYQNVPNTLVVWLCFCYSAVSCTVPALSFVHTTCYSIVFPLMFSLIWFIWLLNTSQHAMGDHHSYPLYPPPLSGPFSSLLCWIALMSSFVAASVVPFPRGVYAITVWSVHLPLVL